MNHLLIAIAVLLAGCGAEVSSPTGQRWILLDRNDGVCSVLGGVRVKKTGQAVEFFSEGPGQITCTSASQGSIATDGSQPTSRTITTPAGDAVFSVEDYLFLGTTQAILLIKN